MIVIDPGHGGKDRGAVNGLIHEADFALGISNYLMMEFHQSGIRCLMTRMADVFVSLHDRVKLINSLNPDLVLSIHCNSYYTPTPNGFELFTSRGLTQSDFIATSILQSIKKYLPERKIRTDYSDGDGDKEAGFLVLKETKCPAVLLEVGFISNSADVLWMTNTSNILTFVKAVREGVMNYLFSQSKTPL
jgi:N-acetylmuramoyl-L-alanine amidase